MRNRLNFLAIIGGTIFTNVIAWFDLNADIVTKFLAMGVSVATIVLIIFQAIRLKKKYDIESKENKIKDEQLNQEILKTEMLKEEFKRKK